MESAEASGGAFEPCLGLLTERWGFGSAGPVAGVPDDRSSSDRSIAFDPSAARVRRGADAALDLSGIAKGFGVDLAAEWLLARGVRHFLIEVGGELRGEGVQRSEEHTSELQSLMRISYAVFCLNKKSISY